MSSRYAESEGKPRDSGFEAEEEEVDCCDILQREMRPKHFHLPLSPSLPPPEAKLSFSRGASPDRNKVIIITVTPPAPADASPAPARVSSLSLSRCLGGSGRLLLFLTARDARERLNAGNLME